MSRIHTNTCLSVISSLSFNRNTVNSGTLHPLQTDFSLQLLLCSAAPVLSLPTDLLLTQCPTQLNKLHSKMQQISEGLSGICRVVTLAVRILNESSAVLVLLQRFLSLMDSGNLCSINMLARGKILAPA